MFKDDLLDELPPQRDMDYEINVHSDQPPAARPVIRLSSAELTELKRQIQDLLRKGFLRPSESPYGVPVFFVRKKSEELRMEWEYLALKKITIPDATPLSLIYEALDQVIEATVFSKIDLIGAYHQMRIRECVIPKTAIRARFGTFEWTVLYIRLQNAPASFTRLLSTLLRTLNGDCLVLFLDDVLVYSANTPVILVQHYTPGTTVWQPVYV